MRHGSVPKNETFNGFTDILAHGLCRLSVRRAKRALKSRQRAGDRRRCLQTPVSPVGVPVAVQEVLVYSSS